MQNDQTFQVNKEDYKNHRKKGTTITFTSDELSVLAKHVAAGTLLLGTSHPVFSRIRAALTKRGLAVPKGL